MGGELKYFINFQQIGGTLTSLCIRKMKNAENNFRTLAKLNSFWTVFNSSERIERKAGWQASLILYMFTPYFIFIYEPGPENVLNLRNDFYKRILGSINGRFVTLNQFFLLRKSLMYQERIQVSPSSTMLFAIWFIVTARVHFYTNASHTQWFLPIVKCKWAIT